MNRPHVHRYYIGSIVCVILLGISFFISSPPINFDMILTPPSFTHLLGTDVLGRDILLRLIIGARNSISISLITVCFTAAIGIGVSILGVSYRFMYPFISLMVYIALAIPPLIICLLFISRIGEGISALIIGQFLAFIPIFSRLSYRELKTVMQSEFAKTAIGLGNHPFVVSYTHGFPILLPKIRAQMLSFMAVAIGIESGLSYLGLGPPPPNAGLGQILYKAINYWSIAPWYPLATLLAFFTILVIINRLIILSQRT